MSSDTIFQVTDLSSKRVEFVQAARNGRARLRDKDGTSFLMLPESRVHVLEELADWSSAYLRLERLLKRATTPTVADLGALAWLRVFDSEDQGAFLDELNDALVAAAADGRLEPVARLVHEWRITANQLDDPLRRSVLLGGEPDSDEFVDAARPE